MQVFVNGVAVELVPGMTVRHALVAACLMGEVERGQRPFDAWGNELGLDGALAHGAEVRLADRTPVTAAPAARRSGRRKP